MNIPAFLRDAEMELLDKLGTCQTKEELDNALTQEGIDHTAADLGPLFAALTPMRSPSAADDLFSNFSSADFESMASKLQSMMSGGVNSAEKAKANPSGDPSGVNMGSLNDLLSFLSNNKEK